MHWSVKLDINFESILGHVLIYGEGLKHVWQYNVLSTSKNLDIEHLGENKIRRSM